MPLSVAFRADASVEIGTGHVMRCLTLADALARSGARCRFLCRDLPGHRADVVAARGHRVDVLPPTQPAEPGPTPPQHATWLPVPQEVDAQQCADLLADEPPDLVVVDHYALDARWERRLRAPARRVMVLDDLADRPHDCDMLLDQNLGRRAEDYEGLLPPHARRFVGPRFALVGPDFPARREASLARRATPELRRLLVSLGGVDRDNVTARVLDALAALEPPPVRHVDVILGAAAPWHDDVAARARTLPMAAEVHVDTQDMAGLMVTADLAIGAGGGTSWERCCMGLPTLLLVLAENQASAARALETAGACIMLDGPAALPSALALAQRPGTLAAMSGAAAAICDGKGADRVSRSLLSSVPELRRATSADARSVWEWRHADGAARYYRSGAETPFPDHERWFADALADPDRLLLIASLRGAPAAHIRFDRLVDGLAEVSICMAPGARGQGLARACLEAALAHARDRGVVRVSAAVHADNAASVRLFEGAGFAFRTREGRFITYERPTEE